jgi:hypothetical protein
MAPKQIDYELSMHAYRTGGHQARQKVLELKDELKDFHNQVGSQVKESEKGCFGGAFNAWLRAGAPEQVCTVQHMAMIEGFAISEIERLISTEEIDGQADVMGEQAVEEFKAFDMRLGEGQLSRAEQDVGMEWCLGHKEGGEAKYEE